MFHLLDRVAEPVPLHLGHGLLLGLLVVLHLVHYDLKLRGSQVALLECLDRAFQTIQTPCAVRDGPRGVPVEGLAVLLPLVPIPLIITLVGPEVLPVALFEGVLILPDVLPVVLPAEDSFGVHVVVLEHALIYLAVPPPELALPMDVVVVELPLVLALVSEDDQPLPLLHPLTVLSLVLSPVHRVLDARPVWQVFAPESLVRVALVVHVLAEAMRPVVEPSALVTSPVGVDHAAPVASLAFLPESFV